VPLQLSGQSGMQTGADFTALKKFVTVQSPSLTEVVVNDAEKVRLEDMKCSDNHRLLLSLLGFQMRGYWILS